MGLEQPGNPSGSQSLGERQKPDKHIQRRIGLLARYTFPIHHIAATVASYLYEQAPMHRAADLPCHLPFLCPDFGPEFGGVSSIYHPKIAISFRFFSVCQTGGGCAIHLLLYCSIIVSSTAFEATRVASVDGSHPLNLAQFSQAGKFVRNGASLLHALRDPKNTLHFELEHAEKCNTEGAPNCWAAF